MVYALIAVSLLILAGLGLAGLMLSGRDTAASSDDDMSDRD
jgi:hypothetical protein